jgi:hypothetical protein
MVIGVLPASPTSTVEIVVVGGVVAEVDMFLIRMVRVFDFEPPPLPPPAKPSVGTKSNIESIARVVNCSFVAMFMAHREGVILLESL